ncbi:hypothetical protein OBBRIDRAFT_839067 [Obba rivulosa]|uniref:Uncharacterized protein n=1 Tax=Obba rivulosa TaxID=1052685 RepID=A0A8E2AJE2_9APHY|nr:hypothetical protein OBBRIDRAFT_839067 [Obba rivulosa]
MPRPKRSPELMQALRNKHTALEAQAAAEKEENINKLAELEAAMARTDSEAAQHADHPPTAASEDKRRRLRRVTVAAARTAEEQSRGSLEPSNDQNDKLLLGESDDSQDEYQPPRSGDEEIEDELDRSERELESDEDEVSPGRPTKQTKPKKPKASKKARLPSTPGGLASNWKDRLNRKADDLTEQVPLLQRTARSASASSLSSLALPISDPEMISPAVEEDGVRFGGLEDEDESAEQAAQPKARPSLTSLTVIRLGVAYAKPPRGSRKDGKNVRVRWMTAHIPDEQRDEFSLSFVPLARELAGTRGPWDSLTVSDVQRVYDRVYPDHPYQVTDKDVFHTLANYRVSDWRSMFSATALDSVKKLIEDNEEDGTIKDVDDISYAIKHLLGDGKTRMPFCWKQCDDERKAGRFQHFLILYTLSSHFTTLFAIPDHFRKSKDFPKGALILSVLVVERALNVWRSGMLVIPPKSAGHFSEQNWGDHVEHRDGRAVMNRKTSKFIPVVDKLREADWGKILSGAHEWFIERTKKIPDLVASPEPSSDGEFDMESDLE